MARTRAGQSSARRAVAAKAPRKLAVAPPPTRVTPTSSKGKVSKRKLPGGGNPIKIWPTPSWQKSIQSFFSSQGDTSKESSASDNSENDDSFEGPSGSGNTSNEHCSPPVTNAPDIDTDSNSEE